MLEVCFSFLFCCHTIGHTDTSTTHMQYLKLKIQLHVHLTVSVTVPPVLSVPHLEYTAVRGQPVSLECTADGQPKPEVTWHRERRPVVEGTHLRLFSNGTLHITATQRSDAGIYTCSARNNAGRASHNVRLILQSEFHTITIYT